MITIVNLIASVVPRGVVIMLLVGFLRQSQGMTKAPLKFFPKRPVRSLLSPSHPALPITIRRFGWSQSFSDDDAGERKRGDHTSQSVGGTITARILPKSMVDCELRKPAARDKNVSEWRERVVQPPTLQSASPPFSSIDLNIPKLSIDDNTEEWTVSLDVNMQTTIDDAVDGEPSMPRTIQVQFNLNRLAFETAERTLERLFLSSRRKIASMAYPFNRCKNKPSLRNIQSSCSTNGMGSSHHSDYSSSLSLESGSHTSILIPSNEHAKDFRPYKVDADMLGVELWTELASYPNGGTIVLNMYDDSDSNSSILSTMATNIIPLKVESCPPTIVSVSTFEDFQSNIFVGVPLCIETEVINAKRARIIWFVEDRQVLYDSPVYTPVVEDVGKKISVLITPVRTWSTSNEEVGTIDYSDFDEVYHFGNKVEKRPFLPIVNMRESWLDQRSMQNDPIKGLRIMSYNLLADLYISRDLEQRTMYQHCDAQFLPKGRRMPLLVYEILAYQPDVVCLQEVDASVFEELFRPVLTSQGYRGYYSNKESKQLEGM